VITVDFETKSYADLKKVGAWTYSEDPTTDVICVCWGIDDKPIREWWPGKEPKLAEDGLPDILEHNNMPRDLYMAMMLGHTVEAHNVSFERSIWVNVLAPRYGWLIPYDHAWRDTMAVAAYYALPHALDRLARALKFQGKGPEGNRLITKYSKLHLQTAKTEIPDEDFWKFVDYCKQDVRIEQSISDHLGDLPDRELPIFRLSQEVNMRGLHLDATGIDAATAIVDQRSEALTEEFRGLVGFNPAQRDKGMAWFHEQGLELENMQAEYLEAILDEGELPSGPCRRALEIRLQINKASTKKLDAMSRQRGLDGRARFQTRYHGAGTGRETGSGFQVLNLVRSWEDVSPEQLVRDIMHGDAQWLDSVYGDATEAISKASRHWITAEPGNFILSGDFASVEAVGVACLSEEEWKIQAFKEGVKIYEMMGEKIHSLPPGTVTKATHPQERQDGKTGELAFGYQGALGAWLKFDNSGRHSDERIIEICRSWRHEHPCIVSFWYALESAAISAVLTPGREFRPTNKGHELAIGFEIVDEWLTMILPNDKRLWYYDPQIRSTMPQWHQPLTKDDCAAGACDCKLRPQLTYMAQKEGQWRRTHTYGGKLAENATQATCREILMASMLRLKENGFSTEGEDHGIILSVYDEIVLELPKGFRGLSEEKLKDEFESLISEVPGWAIGWPVRAEAWIGDRYKK